MTPQNDATQAMAAALGRVPSGLAILTARSGDQETGMLISWVQQCSFHPPRVSLALRPDREVLAWLDAGACFTLNLLGEGHARFVSHFGKGFSLNEPAFTGLAVERDTEQAPVLTDALAYLRCRVVARHSVGDHDLLIADVTGGRMLIADGKPMVHVRKSGLRY